MRARIAAAACLGALWAMAGGIAVAAPDAGPTGLWVVEDGKGAIDIEPCGDKLCGNLAWLKNPLNDQGKPKTDIHNDDASLRARPLCGLPILWGFGPDGDKAWSGGNIYDAEHGETYRSNMHLQDDGTLRVRGYVGISLLGKTQVWTRPSGTLPHC